MASCALRAQLVMLAPTAAPAAKRAAAPPPRHALPPESLLTLNHLPTTARLPREDAEHVAEAVLAFLNEARLKRTRRRGERVVGGGTAGEGGAEKGSERETAKAAELKRLREEMAALAERMRQLEMS